jgi:flagellar protein FlaJ
VSFYDKMAMRYLSTYIEPHLSFFSDLKRDLKMSDMKKTLIEYLSTSFMTCILIFIIELPILSFIFSLLGFGIFFSLFMAFTVSIAICTLFFLFFLNYPKFSISDKSREIEKSLPFAGIYLSTIASSRLPPHKIFRIFSTFEEFGEITNESKKIVADMDMFGMNVYDSLLKAIERTPSKDLKDLFYAMISTLKSGGDLSVYLFEKAETYLNNYRRKLKEFAHTLSIFLELYLTVLVLGTIFFIILTSVMSGFTGAVAEDLIYIQFFLIFFFVPLMSGAFIVLIKSASPGGG